MDDEKKQLLLGVLQRALGSDNPNVERFLRIGADVREVLDNGTIAELQFLHGMLDGALCQLPEFIQKRRDQDKASGK